jgi:hypothetical protein
VVSGTAGISVDWVCGRTGGFAVVVIVLSSGLSGFVLILISISLYARGA